MRDMFGNELTEAEAYDLLKRKSPVPRGHYYMPGTGPAGETCGSCKHIHRNRLAKTYLKCGLNRAKWTGGPASDIRARDAACKFWEPQPAITTAIRSRTAAEENKDED